MHYASKKAWQILRTKQETLAPNVFANEVLGESYDGGSKLVTLTELQQAANLGFRNTGPKLEILPEVKERLIRYVRVAIGVDWGGGGKDEVSYTKLSLCGLKPDGKIDCVWGAKLLTPHDHEREANDVLQTWKKFGAHIMAHDYTGAGSIRQTIMVQSGIPLERIVSCYMHGTSKSLIKYVPPTDNDPYPYYLLNKTRTLLTTCQAIKKGVLRFFDYDHIDDQQPGLLHDFLALVDDKRESPSGSDVYMIHAQEGQSDDFAQATNLACIALWHSADAFPDFGAIMGMANYEKLLELRSSIGALPPTEHD
jgi:hypothetical protein